MVEDTYLEEDSILDLFYEYIYVHKVIDSRIYFLEVNEGQKSYHQLFEEQRDTSPNAVNEGLDVNDKPY